MSNFALFSAAAIWLIAAGHVENSDIRFVPDLPALGGKLDGRTVSYKCSPEVPSCTLDQQVSYNSSNIAIRDNCVRAVTGTDKGLAAQTAHKADCASLFSYTYIPPNVTNTFYMTPPHATETITQTLATVTNTVETTTETIITSWSNSLSFPVPKGPSKRALNTGSVISPSSVPP